MAHRGPILLARPEKLGEVLHRESKSLSAFDKAPAAQELELTLEQSVGLLWKATDGSLDLCQTGQYPMDSVSGFLVTTLLGNSSQRRLWVAARAVRGESVGKREGSDPFPLGFMTGCQGYGGCFRKSSFFLTWAAFHIVKSVSGYF
ncbi:uncharacterized protein VTP21DRAFT_11223 [Calcarisporiella thermophila]|uniref:uncharacterized protein n=1 Tax=Calcarisporiella thermophila TaxID=911321 RepID=UPI003741F094